MHSISGSGTIFSSLFFFFYHKTVGNSASGHSLCTQSVGLYAWPECISLQQVSSNLFFPRNDRMERKDLPTWNSLIAGYFRWGYGGSIGFVSRDAIQKCDDIQLLAEWQVLRRARNIPGNGEESKG
ncbi:OLC1v1000890C1 [Oldenlandia corymbosa var. corymbosa]|uniref:OLC1v1000890C1 n=1 Tax=Oldenlandia corymbosa var. corymbosa TaxID=529605 RepID=A0AAV1D7H3_OLDCO|nr:OLC1v1000890C1 [Oldenlandia corymbosa var. corymbosa]